MKKWLWLWKHRHCWKELKELWERTPEIRKIMLALHFRTLGGEWDAEKEKDLIEKGNECWQWIQYCNSSKVKLIRPWPERPNMPTPLPGSKERIEKAIILPTTGGPNPFKERLLKEQGDKPDK